MGPEATVAGLTAVASIVVVPFGSHCTSTLYSDTIVEYAGKIDRHMGVGTVSAMVSAVSTLQLRERVPPQPIRKAQYAYGEACTAKRLNLHGKHHASCNK